MLFVLIVPMVPLIIWSVSYRWGFPSLLPEFDLWAWQEIASPKIVKSICVSLPISLTVVLLSLILSFLPAKILGQREFRGRRLVELLLLVPTFVPQISIVFGMQDVFRRLGLYSTVYGTIVSQLVFHVPYLTLLLSAVFRNYPPEYEQQAQCLGVGRAKTLFHITLPAIRPGLMVSCVFSFIGSWSTYLLTSAIGPTDVQTLPQLLFPMISSGNNSYPLIAAITLIYIAPVLLFLIASSHVITGEGYDMRRGIL